MRRDFDDPKVTSPEEIFNQDEVRQKVTECFDENASEKEIELALLVTDLVYETRFEKFPTREILSVKIPLLKKRRICCFPILN